MSTEQETLTQHGEGTFEGFGGLQLYYQRWRPPAERAKAALVIIHGFGGHCGLFMNVVNHLVPQGYAVYAFDHRGCGRSPGQRGYIKEWAEYRQDVHTFLRMVERQEPGRPLFLMGESMGGMMVLEYAQHYPEGLAGVIAFAPALGEIGVSPILLRLARLLSRVWPRFSLKSGLETALASRDPAAVEALREDPLIHSRGTARLGTEVLAAIERTQAGASALSVPLLILHGAADQLTAPEGSRNFFQAVALPDKELREYEGAYHMLHVDTCYAQVLDDVEQWMERHL